MSKTFLRIDGIPQPKQRPRHTRNGRTYTPNETIKAEQNIKAVYLQLHRHYFAEKLISIGISFYLPIPQSISKKKALQLENAPHSKKPDIDNLVKLVLDALNGVAYADDKQVVRLSVRKMYSKEPRTEIEIEEV